MKNKNILTALSNKKKKINLMLDNLNSLDSEKIKIYNHFLSNYLKILNSCVKCNFLNKEELELEKDFLHDMGKKISLYKSILCNKLTDKAKYSKLESYSRGKNE